MSKKSKSTPDGEMLMMTQTALVRRLDCHANAVLRDLWGTDDRHRIETDRDELEARRDADRSWRRASKAEKRLQEMADAHLFAVYDRAANDAFERHGLAPKFLKHALRDLREHVQSLDDKEAPSCPKKAKQVFEAFAKAYLRKFPELARARPKKRTRKARAR